jgi:hypothetical protein
MSFNSEASLFLPASVLDRAWQADVCLDMVGKAEAATGWVLYWVGGACPANAVYRMAGAVLPATATLLAVAPLFSAYRGVSIVPVIPSTSQTQSATQSRTRSQSQTRTQTQSTTSTRSQSQSPSPTRSPSPTATPSQSVTPSQTGTRSGTRTASVTATATPSETGSEPDTERLCDALAYLHHYAQWNAYSESLTEPVWNAVRNSDAEPHTFTDAFPLAITNGIWDADRLAAAHAHVDSEPQWVHY